MRIIYLLLMLPGILIGCTASPDFDMKNVERSLTLKQVTDNPDKYKTKNIIWGGTILETRNLKNETQIKVLAYPLNTSHRPLTNKVSLGRFIILHTGYLEPTNYAAGKQLSVSGIISGTKSGMIDETKYTYVQIRAKKMFLWSDESETKTFFHFGIGIEL